VARGADSLGTIGGLLARIGSCTLGRPSLHFTLQAAGRKVTIVGHQVIEICCSRVVDGHTAPFRTWLMIAFKIRCPVLTTGTLIGHA